MCNRFVQLLTVVLLLGSSLNLIAQDADLPVLSLNEAIAQALDRNADFKKASLETQRAVANLAAKRTKLWASTSISGQGSQLLTEPAIKFAEGSLGNFPSTGPIPAKDTTIKIPRDFVGILTASVSQPITYEIKTHFEVQGLRAGLDSSKQDERKQRLATINDVRHAYYAVLDTQSRLQSAEASLHYYQDSKRIANEKRKHEVILESDLLHANKELLQAQNAVDEASDQLASDAEKLNDLMGRSIHTPFRATDADAPDEVDETLASLEARALEHRPDVLKAKLTVREADYNRRAKAAESIPEISAAVDYYTTFNFGSVLPSNIATAGATLKWEPWDWGRRRQETREKQFKTNEAEVAEIEAERSALLEVSSSWRRLRDARRKLTLSDASQADAREQLRETQEQVKREQQPTKSLFSAQSDLATADQEHQQAVTAFWKARADLMKAIGEE